MSFLFRKPRLPEPMEQPSLQSEDTQKAAQDAAAELLKRQAQAKGKQSTILTSSQGDLSTPSLGRKTLLGG